MDTAALKLGLLLPSWTGAMDGVTPTAPQVIEIARLAESVGFDTLWVSDHFYFEPYVDFRVVGVDFPDDYNGVKGGQWECWTLLSALSVATTRVGLGTLVSNTGYRNPALFARMVDTVDDLSDGRVILGLGAGDFITEHAAYGFPFDRRVGRFEEALGILTAMLRGETVNARGEFYQAEQAALLPKARRAGGPPIMIGTLEGKPRMSRLVAQYADIWNSMMAFGDSRVARFEQAWMPIRAACERHDRDPASLSRHATIGINLTDDDYMIPGAAPLGGGVDAIVDGLGNYAAAGVEYVSTMLHPWTHAGVEQFGRIIERLRG